MSEAINDPSFEGVEGSTEEVRAHVRELIATQDVSQIIEALMSQEVSELNRAEANALAGAVIESKDTMRVLMLGDVLAGNSQLLEKLEFRLVKEIDSAVKGSADQLSNSKGTALEHLIGEQDK